MPVAISFVTVMSTLTRPGPRAELPRDIRQDTIDRMRPFYPNVGNMYQIETTGRSVGRHLRIRLQRRSPIDLLGIGLSGSLNYSHRWGEDDNDFTNPYLAAWGLLRLEHTLTSQLRIRLPRDTGVRHPFWRTLEHAHTATLVLVSASHVFLVAGFRRKRGILGAGSREARSQQEANLVGIAIGAYATLGLVLGYARPVGGLVMLVAFVAVTPSLPWQLGLANLATVHAYVATLLVGYAIRVSKRRDSGSPTPLQSLPQDVVTTTALVMATLGVSTAVNSAKALALIPAAAIGDQGRDFVVNIVYFNAPRLAGIAQASFVAAAGPLLLLMVMIAARRPTERRRLQLGWWYGLPVVIGCILIQRLWLDPTIRPDLGRAGLPGVFAFFQDQHSLASYMILHIVVALSVAVAAWRNRNRTLCSAGAAALIAALTVLYLTNSRAGYLGGLVAIGAVVVFCTRLPFPSAVSRTHSIRKYAVVGVVLALFAGLATVTFVGVAGIESMPYSIRQLLTGQVTIGDVLEARVQLWGKALLLIRENPLWGVGPHGFFDAAPLATGSAEVIVGGESIRENAHNYFLQIAAEFGLPALAAYLALLASILRRLYQQTGAHEPTISTLFCGGVGAATLGFIVVSCFSHPLLLPEMQALFFVLLGLGIIEPATMRALTPEN